MTCKEIGEYCEQQKENNRNQMLQESSIQYRICSMLMEMFSKNPKSRSFEELFPELIKNDMQSKEEIIANKWREFLGR